MGRLLKIFLCFSVVVSTQNIWGQHVDNGLWNSGLAYSIVPGDNITSEHCRLLKQHVKTNLYSGVAVVQSEYTLISDSSFTGIFYLPDSPMNTISPVANIHPLASHDLVFFIKDVNGNSIPIITKREGHEIMYAFKGKDTIRLISMQLIQTNQAIISKEGTNKENNAFGFVFNNDGWKGQGERKVFVQLKDKLNLLNIYGVSPSKMVTGDLTHMEYSYDISKDSVLLIWYEGAAADFKFEKKVLPYRQALYDEMKLFDLSSFQTEKFGVIEKNDFGTDKQSKLLSILYFIMFAIPWVILFVFIIFLIFKKKKKSNEAS